MECLNLSQLVMIESIILGLLTLSTPMFIPELRRAFRLEPSLPARPLAFRVYKWSSVCLLVLGLLFLVWFVLCHTIQTTRAAEPPIPDGPIEKVGSAEVDGVQFTLYTFLQGYHWKYDEVEVKFNERPVTGDEMVTYLSRLKETISLGEAVICIGTASRDIEKEKDEAFEEQRADIRSTQMVLWIAPAVSQANQLRPAKQPVEIYRLNLGHYRDGPDKDEQRMLIFIRLKKIDPKVSLEELLAPANQEQLKKKLKEKGFPFSFDSYSLFELIKHT
jgi:hypothetical protein